MGNQASTLQPKRRLDYLRDDGTADPFSYYLYLKQAPKAANGTYIGIYKNGGASSVTFYIILLKPWETNHQRFIPSDKKMEIFQSNLSEKFETLSLKRTDPRE